MDPLSHGIFGASVAHFSAKNPSKLRWALLVGFLAGIAPDLDVLIRSAEDPLLFLEYHRQFTHSLFFIPIGALLCTLALYPFLRKKLTFLELYFCAFLGYSTHGLLDSFTSYGTQLLWPFSSLRVSWNNISIIDPLFTLPILALLFVAFMRKQFRYARYAFIYILAYLSFSMVQHERAQTLVLALATERGHNPVRLISKPTLGNLILWRLVYEYDGRYFVDAAKLGWDSVTIPGKSIAKLDINNDYPWLLKDSVQAKDIERFRWFSAGFLAKVPNDNLMIMDVRYSFIPNELSPLWVIRLNPKTPEQHVEYLDIRDNVIKDRQRFLDLLF